VQQKSKIVMDKMKKLQRIKYQSLLILLFICTVCLVPIHGQESGNLNQSQLEEMVAQHKKEKLANDSEMLRMKLEMEQDKVKTQSLIIIFGVVLCAVLITFALSLYFSSIQIKKKNKLLNEQNHAIMEQKEEITAQSDELALKNEFLDKQNRQLFEVSQEKDRLISVIAHDLRTPLNQSKGFAELLRYTPLQSDQLAMVNMITRVNDDGILLIRDMLQINTLECEQLKPSTFPLDQFIDQNITMAFKPLAIKKGVTFQLSIEEEIYINTDERYLKRILENLVSNALKFSPTNSSISLRVHSTDKAVYISVEDQGPGISEEDQLKIFGRFQKLSARPTSGESSHGLGLSIVKNLVEKIDGELSVISELGKGTSFILRLNKELSFTIESYQNINQQMA
jgi:signal transduction histidine kinase